MSDRTNYELELAREAYRSIGKAKGLPGLRAAFDSQGDRFAPPEEARCTAVELGGRPAEWWDTDCSSERIIYFLHGGGYVLGSLKGYRHLAAEFARVGNSRVLLLDYRLAPEHRFPAALDDALAGYRELLAQGADPYKISFVGDSAGGNLVLTALLALRDAHLPLPACAVCLSPWLNYEADGETMMTKAHVEAGMTREVLLFARQAYFGELDPHQVQVADILNADLSGLPPLLIQVGSHEVLLDDSLRLVGRAAKYDISCTMEVWSKMFHVFQYYYPLLAEAGEAIEHAARFMSFHCTE